jgi:hypothetical protein
MEIKYSLNESDIFALTKYRLKSVPATHQRMRVRRFSYLIGFVFVALGAWILQNNIILVAAFLAFAVAVFLLYPAYYDWNFRRSIQKAYQDEKMRASLASRTLRITQECLEEESSFGEAKIKWNVIENINMTATHTFIIVLGEAPSLIIPKERVNVGNYAEFVDACREHILAKVS